MKNISEKKGITLVILIITIVVALVILSISIVSIKNVIDNASLVTFAKDLSTVEEETSKYYINNEAFPTATEDESSISQR